MHNPRLYRSIYQVRYKKKLSFFVKLSQLCEMGDEFEYWEYSGTSVVLRDQADHFNLSFAAGDCSASLDSHDDSLEVEKRLIKEVTSTLEITDFDRIGHRRFFLTKVDFSFEELVKILSVKLINPEVSKTVPGNLTDSRYTFVSEDDKFDYHIVVGPVESQEIAMHLGQEKKNFKTEEGFEQWKKRYPEVAILIDIDCYTVDKKVAELEELINESSKNTKAVAQKITDTLLSTKL